MQEPALAGRIIGRAVMTVPEFGTRANFRLECPGQCSVICCAAGDVARELITYHCEGDMVLVRGVDEPRPSTASANRPWAGRFRVRALCGLGFVRVNYAYHP